MRFSTKRRQLSVKIDHFYPKEIDEEQEQEIAQVRSDISKMFQKLVVSLPNGRYKAKAISKLDDVCTWAVKAITHDKDQLEIYTKRSVENDVRP